MCCNINEVYWCHNLLPIHRSDLQGHKPLGCSLHTHNPVKDRVKTSNELKLVELNVISINERLNDYNKINLQLG